MSSTGAESDTTPQQTQEQPLPSPRRPLRSTLSFADRTFRNVWFYVAALSLIINLTYTFRPQIGVQASSVIDDPLASLFTLSNNGPWTLYNVSMSCALTNGQRPLIYSEGNMVFTSPSSAIAGNPDIDVMPPGQTATRDCGFPVHMSGPIRIDVTISYKWLWGFISNGTTHHFDTRYIHGHLILVPDLEPGGRPPSS